MWVVAVAWYSVNFFMGLGVRSTLFWVGMLWVVFGGRVSVRLVPCDKDIEILNITMLN